MCQWRRQRNHEEVDLVGSRDIMRGDAVLRSHSGSSHRTLFCSPGRVFKDWPLPGVPGFLSHSEISPCDLSCLPTHLSRYYSLRNDGAGEAITRPELTVGQEPEAPKLGGKRTPFLSRLPSLRYFYDNSSKHVNTEVQQWRRLLCQSP